MNPRTSRRTFVGIAASALATFTGGLGRALGWDANADAATGTPAAESPGALRAPVGTTTYTYDRHARLLSVMEHCNPVATAFARPDA